MARLGSIPLVGGVDSTFPGGAAFLLNSPSTRDEVQRIEGGEIEVHENQPWIVARLAPALDASTAFSAGHGVAQRGLDLMSILGIQDSVIQNAEEEHVIWWTQGEQLFLRAVSTATLGVEVPPVEVQVTDKDGSEIQQPISRPDYNVAFRYYRLAQTTEDLFDSYRNMYLSFELLLSNQFPKKNSETEIAWLRRAITSASTAIRLDDLGVQDSDNATETLIQILYRDARLPLFHAKEGRHYFPPHDSPATREVVANALGILTRIVLRMAETWFAARRMGGAIHFGWVYNSARSLLAKSSAYAFRDDASFDPDNKEESQLSFSEGVRLELSLSSEHQRGHEPAIFSVMSGSQLSKVNPLRRVELVSEGSLLISHNLEAPIELDGIFQFEDLMHIRGVNLSQPRTTFRV